MDACKHCKVNLYGGDIFEYFLQCYSGDAKLAFGWSEKTKVHFSRSIIVQPDKAPQYIICPDCKKQIG